MNMKRLRILVVASMLIIGCSRHDSEAGTSLNYVGDLRAQLDSTGHEPGIKFRVFASGYYERLESWLNGVAHELAQTDQWYISEISYQYSNGAFTAMVIIKKRA